VVALGKTQAAVDRVEIHQTAEEETK
jgi:hypothetical protein